MNDSQYSELLNAILDLRNATELGFMNIAGRFDAVNSRFDTLEERLDRRFSALETLFEKGFRGLEASALAARGAYADDC